MKAVIFGVTGQDGSYLSEFLLEKGYKVIGVSRRASTDNTERLKGILDNPQFTFMEGVFMAGDDHGVIHFPEGQTIKPGIMWGAKPKFDPGVKLEPGLAIPANATFSANLQLPAFVAAPFTSLNPTIAAGWVAGLVEALLRKPQVRDFENLADDITHLKGFWHNNITRILLVVIFANLGSAIGTFAGGFAIATLL